MEVLTQRQRLQTVKAELDRLWVSYEAHLKEIAQHIQPERGEFVLSDKERAGAKKHQLIFDSYATRASRILAAGMMSGLTRPTSIWFRMTVGDRRIRLLGRVKRWLEAAGEEVASLFVRSNLYESFPQVYEDTGTFCTSAMSMVERPDQRDVHTFVFPIGSYRINCDEYGRLDTFHTTREMTLLQIADRWGDGVLPENHRSALRSQGQYQTRLPVHQTIYRNPDGIRGPALPTEREWLRTFWIDEQSGPNDGLLFTDGFIDMPVKISRWARNGDNVYGYGPGMEALADVKMLQQLWRKYLLGLDKSNDPNMQAPASLKRSGLTLLPGRTNYLSEEELRAGGARPTHEVRPDHAGSLAVVQAVYRNIDAAFHADLFRILTESRDQRQTAFEVSQLVAERNTQLGPVLETLSNDLLDPVVEGGYNAANRMGLLEEAPPELANAPIRIEYESVIAAAQKLSTAQNLRTFTTYVSELAAFAPDALDRLDIDEVVQRAADVYGAPAETVRGDEEVEDIREMKERMLQAREAAAAAPGLARAARDAAEATAPLTAQSPGAVSRVAG